MGHFPVAAIHLMRISIPIFDSLAERSQPRMHPLCSAAAGVETGKKHRDEREISSGSGSVTADCSSAGLIITSLQLRGEVGKLGPLLD